MLAEVVRNEIDNVLLVVNHENGLLHGTKLPLPSAAKGLKSDNTRGTTGPICD